LCQGLLAKKLGQFSKLTLNAALPRAMASIYQTKRKTSEKTTSQSPPALAPSLWLLVRVPLLSQ
jgi:hypothetical protein